MLLFKIKLVTKHLSRNIPLYVTNPCVAHRNPPWDPVIKEADSIEHNWTPPTTVLFIGRSDVSIAVTSYSMWFKCHHASFAKTELALIDTTQTY